MDLLCHTIKPYICTNCNQDTLFFYTKKGTLIDYKTLMVNGTTRKELIEELQYKNVKYLKCINCGKTFIMDWRKRFPIPLEDRNKLTEFGV